MSDALRPEPRMPDHDIAGPLAWQAPQVATDDWQVPIPDAALALIRRGHELAQEPLDDLGRDALQAISDVMSEPDHHLRFVLEPGQIQFINNYNLAHARTDFVDHDEPDAKRHLVRIFLRDEGRRSYMG